ncbi:rubredoxin reductase [Bacillus phage 000TH008]|nr:rubredoxin reductase [Bacillus phage 000TH008]QQO40817.1 rubredoxin reductase [Bacillus phage 000TH009]
MSKQPFNLEWVCTCGTKNISVVDHLNCVQPSHTIFRCRECNERKLVSIRVEVRAEEEGLKWLRENSDT